MSNFVPPTNTLIFEEGVGTSGTSVQLNNSGFDSEVIGVTWSVIESEPASPLVLPLTGLTVTWATNTFTFSGLFDTWFSRRTTYNTEEGIVNSNMTYKYDNQVAKPIDLPEVFYAVHKVESPPTFLTLTFAVQARERTSAVPSSTVDGVTTPAVPAGDWVTSTYNWSCKVNHNNNANITAVRYAVDRGENVKRYLASGGNV